MSFEVSVVIPVYNAARYVQEAVESALAQPEVAEVVLVEDGSPDDSMAACRALAEKYGQVRLYQHPGAANRGAGPSRNMGIVKSTAPYIAFLDADDFYLPGRFSVPRQVFESNPDCDGVYEALGIHFEDEAGQARWQASEMGHVRLTCMDKPFPPADLFRVLMKGGSGHIHLNGLVIRRTILQKSGLMDDSIADTLHEDVDFVMRLAAVGNLYPGRIDQPTSMRRVHAENRVSAPRPAHLVHRDKMRLRRATYRWSRQNGTPEQRVLAFRRMLLEWVSYQSDSRAAKGRSRHAYRLNRLLCWPFTDPSVLLEGTFWLETARTFWAVLKRDILKRQAT